MCKLHKGKNGEKKLTRHSKECLDLMTQTKDGICICEASDGHVCVDCGVGLKTVGTCEDCQKKKEFKPEDSERPEWDWLKK